MRWCPTSADYRSPWRDHKTLRNSLHLQSSFLDYVYVLKPRETILLTFIGACTAIVATNGNVQYETLALLIITILLGSAAANGLTNYLDRNIDAGMERTRHRVIPSGRISPPHKALPLILSLLIASLALAWILNPLCFVVGLIGITSSIIWRKTISCTFLGIIAGCSPVLIGWLAVRPIFNIEILLICCTIALWIPIHVWSVMVANRKDYMSAGLTYFPLNLKDRTIVKMLLGLSVSLYAAVMLLYWFGNFGLLYLIIGNIISIIMIYANARLLFSATSSVAWRVYKISAFPYLGIMFLTICLDVLLL